MTTTTTTPPDFHTEVLPGIPSPSGRSLLHEPSGRRWCWRLTITQDGVQTYASEWAVLRDGDEEAARAEARERCVLVMARVLGAAVESLAPPEQRCECGAVPLPDRRTVQVRLVGAIVHHEPQDRCWREPLRAVGDNPQA